jgi:hypothetical protein
LNIAPSTGPDQAIKCDPDRERSAAKNSHAGFALL